MQEADQKMAQVVYYLCRNGKVESPHMIDVEFHSPGLRLRDVKLRLTTLRGIRMPAMYSWSFKRIYKNTSIWQDVSDDDFVLPVLSGEFVLKGSEIVDNAQSQVPVLKSQSLKQPSEILQRKFWGAESWLTSPVEAPAPPPKASSMQAQRRSWEQAQQLCNKSTTRRLLSVGESSSSDEKESQLRLGSSHHDSDLRHSHHQDPDSKVYTIKPPLIDHGCDATTQTDEHRRRNTALAASSEERKACIVEETKKELIVVPESPAAPATPQKKQSKSKKQDHSKELRGSKNGGSWMFLHVLSYCGAGGLDTKAQQGGSTPLVTKGGEIVPSEYDRESSRATDAEHFSFSDTSRETHQSRASTTGDSFNSSDASDEGRAQSFVDVKELLVTSSSTRVGAPSASTTGASSGKSSLIGRNYGRLSKSGSYWPRNIKYDLSRRQLENGFELNCYNAE